MQFEMNRCNNVKTNKITQKATIIPILIFMLNIYATAVSYAQHAYGTQWERELANMTGPSSASLNACVALDDKVVVGGYASNSSGQEGMYLSAFDQNGMTLWDTSFLTPNFSSVRFMTTSTAGEIYAAAREHTGINLIRLHLLKLHTDGSIVWHKQYNGPNNRLSNIYEMRLFDNAIFICGTEDNDIGYETSMVAKFNENGNMVWDKTIDPGVQSTVSNLSFHNNGKIVTAGRANNGFSFFIVQLNADGTTDWQYPQNISNGALRSVSDIEIANDGNIYAIGTEEASAFYEMDIVTLKIAESGTLLWKRNYNTEGENSGVEVRILADGTILSIGNKEENFNSFAIIIAYNSGGLQLWESTYDIDFATRVSGALVDENEDIILSVRDFDGSGVVKFSSNGTQLDDRTFDLNEADFIGDFSLDGGILYALTSTFSPAKSVLRGLQFSTFSDIFMTEVQGEKISHIIPQNIKTQNNVTALTSISKDGDSTNCVINIFAPNGQILNQISKKIIGTSATYDKIEVMPNGNIFSLIHSNRFSQGQTSYIQKYNSAGSEIFSFKIPDMSDKGGLAVGKNGHFFVSGYNEDTREMFLTRFGAQGNEIWSRTYQSPANFSFSEPLDMQFTTNDNLVIVATHKGIDDDNDLHVFQYDSDGNLEWHMDVVDQGGNIVDVASFQVDSDGTIYLFGSSGTGAFVAASYDGSGSQNWIYAGQNPSQSSPRSMSIDNEKNIYLCFSGVGEFKVRKLDNLGQLTLDKNFSIPTSQSYFFPNTSTVINGNINIIGQHGLNDERWPFWYIIDSELNSVYTTVDSSLNAQVTAISKDDYGKIYASFVAGDLGDFNGARKALVSKYACSISAQQNTEICEGDTLIFGAYSITNAGIFIDTIPSPNGCDSIIELAVSVNLINETVVQSDSSIIVANPSSDYSYQWIDCTRAIDIPGATGSEFIPQETGQYAVRISDGTCTNISSCEHFIFSSIHDVTTEDIRVYPNPTNTALYINRTQARNPTSIKIYDQIGRVIYTQKIIRETDITVNTQSWPVGFYTVTLFANNKKESIKIIKQ